MAREASTDVSDDGARTEGAQTAEAQTEEARPEGARPQTFADKLSRLFDVLHPAGERPMSTRELAARVKEHGGRISAAYISELRTGKKTNPTMDHIVGIAAAFGVPAGYFIDEEIAGRVGAELDRLEELKRNTALAELAEQQVTINLRTARLSDDDREGFDEMVAAFWARRKQRRKSQ
jgi:transcriptional regulator with XRE-family HTH domain